MKAYLMIKDRDFDLQAQLPANEQDLIQDLELTTLFDAMARGDKFLYDVVKRALLTSLANGLDTIHYRQHILQDCLANPEIVREMYGIAVEAIERERKNFWGLSSKHPDLILRRSTQVMQMFVEQLKRLKEVADQNAGQFTSEGFATFFAMLQRELDDEYFASVQHHLKQLQFRGGVLVSVGLGPGNKGSKYVLRQPNHKKQNWVERALAPRTPAYTVRIADRDESGAKALAELRDRGLNPVANALAQSADHILSFFVMLRAELGFYVGCINLYEQLARLGAPVCFAQPMPIDQRRHTCQGVYDVCLSLVLGRKIIGNDLHANNKRLVLITGANQGGKSTFLRSIGLAQLMMQGGMFTAAESFSANVCDGLFTHYRREEDASMSSGKLDEELSRMNDIINQITSNALVLFNESFAATNEREGSEIARQIVSALFEQSIKMFFVTHLYTFANGFFDRNVDGTLFLQAERQTDGERTFRMVEAEPSRTSYGQDLYHRIFG